MERLENLEVLSWLAGCQCNRCVAVPIPEEVQGTLRQLRLDWTQGICHLERDLEYEPRSLAFSSDGTRIAMGTKAGTIHLALWNGSNWEVPEEPCRITPVSGAGPSTRSFGRAVRGLCFLGPDRLIASGGPGLFKALDLSAPEQETTELPVENLSPDMRPLGEDRWLLHFVKILPLFAGPEAPAAPGSPLAFGLTRGRYLHVLRCGREGRLEATHAIPEDLLGPSVGRAWIVDAEWWKERLWLLDSEGRIHRLRPGWGLLGLEPDMPAFRIPYFRARIDPRSISLCHSGIGVRIGEDVTFLPFKSPQEQRLRNEGVQWVAVPGAIRCITVQEFGTRDWAYLAVATSDAGVRWIPWRYNPPGDLWQPWNRGGQQPLSGNSDRDPVLEMALVRVHGTDRVYLVLGTRGHRMRIASLLDKNRIQAHLAEGIQEALRKAEDEEEPDQGALRHLLEKSQPGMALRLFRALIDRELDAAYRSDSEDGPPAADLLAKNEARLFEALDLSDLTDVLRYSGRSWKKAHDHAEKSKEEESVLSPPERRANVFRRFCLRVFQRAARIDEESLRELARVTLEGIEDLRRDLPAEEWRGVGLFGGFLRKWLIYGYTYGEKRENLLQLSEWNRTCGRDLDAIFYLTRVLRSRVDAAWLRAVEPTGVDPGIWDLVATDTASFVLHSHTDGRIFATSHDGKPVSWVLGGYAEMLGRGAIVTCDGGLALCHREADSFRERYRHGPYARSLYIGELETEGSFLVVFGIRGWHPTDLTQGDLEGDRPRLPRLVALAVEWRGGEEDPRLVIREAAVCILDFEPYAIARLPARGEDGRGIGFVVGTGGGSKVPFVEMRILPSVEEVAAPAQGQAAFLHTSGLAMTWQRPGIQEDPRWRAIRLFSDSPQTQDLATRFEQGSNPCWAAQALEGRPQSGGAGAVWLWIGMQDGRVRPFLWDAAGRRWLEGGPRHRDEHGRQIRPVLDPLLTYSPLRRLRLLDRPGGAGSDGPLLAYGNAAGVVGVVPLDHLSEARAERATPERPLPERNEPWIHLIHAREKRAICGLADYQDGGDWNLAVLTESGRVAIFNLAHQRENPRVEGRRFVHRGLRLDYFLLLPANARALVAASGHDPGAWEALRDEERPDDNERERPLPFLVIGGEDGTVAGHVLTFPKFSPRRNSQAVPRILDLFRRQVEDPEYDHESPVPYLVRTLGRDSIHSWLRLCDVGGKSLLRFSLWYELQDLHQRHFPPFEPSGDISRTVGSLVRKLREYIKKLRSLADEVYGRKPFDTEAAKILWSETARYANKVAGLGVIHGEIRGRTLWAYKRLLGEMDHLSNRWIGTGQPAEAKVLMHSFADLFDWPCIVLLALDDPGEDLQEARKPLLFQAVQRRLRHNDLLVPLEAIRVINTAILRAIVKRRQQHPAWAFAHRPQHKGGFGFYDLLTLVSDLLVRQQAGRLTPSDPLYTEISKLFALSILLVPNGIFAVGRLVSASRLVEHENDVGRRILLHARMFRDQLHRDFGIPPDEPRSVQPISRFEDYLSREVGGEPWRRLLSDPGDASEPVLTDPHYLSEQRKVLLTVTHLAHLHPTDAAPADPQLLSWLKECPRPRYFLESRLYLRRLNRRRKHMMRMLQKGSPGTLHELFQICNEEIRLLEGLPHLVEPQKSHYRFILEQWRSYLDWRGEQAIDLVRLIERFNRHVYRTSADDLMASLTELALRSAPIAFPCPPPRGGELPLRLQIRDQIRPFPFTSELFRRGTLLVQGSHLAATLLYLATLCLNRGSAPEGRLFSWQFTLPKIREKAEEIANLEGVDFDFHPTIPPEGLVPGDELIWSTILRELARNVYDYCPGSNGRKAKLRLVCHRSAAGPDGHAWFLAAGGGLPFYAALDEAPQREVDAAREPQEALLEKAKAILREPGVRYQAELRGSFGFGLYFLHRLFDLLGDARADLLLLDPDNLSYAVTGTGQKARVEQPRETDLRTLPLTMVFSWKSA